MEDNGAKKCLLDHISFQVDDGEMLVITGPNGGGKSTLAKVLIGIEKAESGKIFLNGEDITDFDINHRANQECCRLLSDVGLCAEEYLGRQIDGTLSGGEMKRIEIATVLAKEHTLCIFDEPEAGIDLWSFSMLIRKFEEIHKEKKQSLIVISHQEKIISMADRIMVIDDGKIKAEGRKEDVLPCLEGLDKCHACAGNAGVRA